MKLYIEGHSFGYELQRVAQMFFPGERIEVAEGPPPAGEECIVTRLANGTVWVGYGAENEFDDWCPDDAPATLEWKFGVVLYQVLSAATGIRPPWGALTGVRPVKLLLQRRRAGLGEEELRDYFVEERLVSPEKYALARRTADAEEAILARSTPDSFSLYVSVPFCPTRCAYCSFVSHSVEQAAKLIPDYVDRLCEELRETGRLARELGLRLRTVYFGGGTPTTLTAEQLRRVCGAVAEHFDVGGAWEYTVEAGRPDTVAPDKLRALRDAGVGRVSINPQTLSDRVLREIGRRHTAAQFFEAWKMARDAGFSCINADLIAGLPTDTAEGFARTLEGVLALAPENLTVHTLTVKRAARLGFEEARGELDLVGGMVDRARRAAEEAGLSPYYLYRQNGTLGNLENVGYARPGTEGLYNVYVMDETHTVLAVGAGATTKLRHPATGQIRRVFNYKYPYEYIARFDEMLHRKRGVLEFYVGDGSGRL